MGKLQFVNAPHGGTCSNCFRPCVREGDKWRILTKTEVPQISLVTANKWRKAREGAAGSSS